MKIYIPLLYSEKFKRPGRKYFLNNIIGEDFIILLLSFTCHSSYPLSNAIGLFLLQISFWCIYELGYIENDIIGEKFEDGAILSHTYKSYECYFHSWQPWVCSFILSFIGIIVLGRDIVVAGNFHYFTSFGQYNYDLLAIFESCLFWGIFLLVLKVLFHVYNHLNKQTRVWFYLLLQACRYCGYLVLLTTNIVGLAFLLSVTITRSMQYIIYRYLGGKSNSWPMEFPKYFFYLLIYLLLIVVIAANEHDLSLIINFPMLLTIAYCMARGRKQFFRVFSQFIHVSKDSSNQVI